MWAPPIVGQPLVVAYGMGVDSTAMLILLRNQGIRPDLILFSDTGSEKPETYAYLEIIQKWLVEQGFPPVTVLRRSELVNQRVPDRSIEDEMVRLRCLPSLAFGMHTCSHKWKIVPQEKFLRSWEPAQRSWAAGMPIVRAIGFDCSGADAKRTFRISKHDGKKYQSWFPLQDYGIDRSSCEELIRGEGLPVPAKSACYFCPAMKRHEIIALAINQPELAAKALAIEDAARLSGKMTTTKGLGRSFNWREFLVEAGISDL